MLQKNPAWIPESKLNRTKDYDKIKKEIHYNAKQGPLARMQSIRVPGPVTANSQAEVTSTFIVMTPNGADAPVTIDRKLFVIADGKETEVAFPGHSFQQLTLEPGKQQDVSHIPDSSRRQAGQHVPCADGGYDRRKPDGSRVSTVHRHSVTRRPGGESVALRFFREPALRWGSARAFPGLL